MTRWITGPVAALVVGCAQGAPLDGESGGTEGPTAGTAMTTPMTGGTTGLEPTTTTPELTTSSSTTSTTSTTTGDTTGPDPSGTTDTTTGTGGEPTVLGEYYPFDAVHSPITPDVAAAIQAHASKGDQTDGVFAKVGGSSTASPNFAHCLSDAPEVMALPPALQPALDFFNANAAGVGMTSFNRVGLAAMPGWTTTDVLAGMPSPLMSEVTEIEPRFAVVLLGTHEIELPQPEGLFTFADELLTIVDTLIGGGTVPILSTLPDRIDLPEYAAHVPRFNAVIRAIAQGRQVPLLDLNLALAGQPGQGLADDGIDLNVAIGMDMIPQPCQFALAGIVKGYNRRNLVTLEALGRAIEALEMGGDEDAPLLLGAGTLAEPIVIPGLPFVDFRSTAASTSDAIDSYAGACQAMGTEGPEYIYELTVDAPTTIRAAVFDQGTADVDLHLMTLADPATCVKTGESQLSGPLQPGTYYLSVDTLGTATPGEFGFVVLTED